MKAEGEKESRRGRTRRIGGEGKIVWWREDRGRGGKRREGKERVCEDGDGGGGRREE